MLKKIDFFNYVKILQLIIFNYENKLILYINCNYNLCINYFEVFYFLGKYFLITKYIFLIINFLITTKSK